MGEVDRSAQRFLDHERRLAELERSGGGGDNGNMDDWKTSIESRLTQLHQDICGLRTFLLVAYGAAFVVLLGFFGAGYAKLDGKIDGKFDQLDSRLDDINITLTEIKAALPQPKR